MALEIAGGTVYFDRFDAAGLKTGERKIGATQGAAMTTTPQKIASYNNDDAALGVKEDEVTTRVDRAMTVPTRDIVAENLALAFFGSAATFTQAGGAVVAEAINDVTPDRYYQLGVSAGAPTGARSVSLVVVKDDTTPTPVTFTLNTDYTVDAALGRIYIVPGGAIVAGTNLRVDYTAAAKTWEQVISTGDQANGALRIIGQSAKGTPRDYYFPKVSLSVNGEFALKSDPENPAYQTIPLEVEILEDTANALKAVYIDGRPAA